MSDSVTVAVIAGIVAICTGIITGVFAMRSHRDTNLRDDVKSLRSEVGELRAKVLTLQDYAMELRDDAEAAGIPVRPWPDSMKR